ncbi:CGNR zinc finger domain-containing protein [Rhodococcus fascians]|uniref:CGNR zinc finger domain-containing protein n=1 Tax=Rhodococcoides fascians TaxID=1828 RepID=UPI00050C77DD|nr:CGNR zinc finger domain-containing protein [Rhodococcus fascians]MBY3988339.1 CGNR zinc finger domain-containing protein [Rhodococcus fascians]MBY3997519.1 CGNR zinc finger domain-containing protein [Rhodococcus fascians]MBY4004093.1 CGNR zinc finger domain-containing protein [Rhodococcus fascians]MBY4008654.1 CGNR zinc finger domain-containing protein [Rhodococcus fascians]MBY4019014.1 CGNR zinc finger domain-containing protein [Rhodococcus fascians]
MLFAHDAELSLLSAVALVNSAEDPDTLTTREELAEFFTDQGYSGRFDGDDAELEAVRALRPTLRSLLTSSRDDAVIEVNRLLAESSALPRLVRHDTLDWHVHAVADDSPLATRIVVETAMAMIDVIRADELSRFDVCADPDCNGLVLDLSRNRSRRFCSTTCGNRAAVAAYRARKAQ